MKDQVRRMAENDEPKCKNCSWWACDPAKTIGTCMLNSEQAISDDVSHFLLRNTTTDLSLCSAWEPKE